MLPPPRHQKRVPNRHITHTSRKFQCQRGLTSSVSFPATSPRPSDHAANISLLNRRLANLSLSVWNTSYARSFHHWMSYNRISSAPLPAILAWECAGRLGWELWGEWVLWGWNFTFVLFVAKMYLQLENWILSLCFWSIKILNVYS